MPYKLKSLRRRGKAASLSENARPRTAGAACRGQQPWDDSRFMSMVDLSTMSHRYIPQKHERPKTASGLPMDRESNGLALNPPTPFVYGRQPQSVIPSSIQDESPIGLSQIGVALGSPRELVENQQECPNGGIRPSINRGLTAGANGRFNTSVLEAEDRDLTSSTKVKRWTSVSGLLGRMRSSTVTSQPLMPVLDQANRRPPGHSSQHSVVKSSLESARKSLHLKRKVKPRSSVLPPKDESFKRQYPPLVIPKDIPLVSGPISTMSPQIDVVIPTAELDRYSTMFGDAFQKQIAQRMAQQQQASKPPPLSLLERRQKSMADLRISNALMKNRKSVQTRSISAVSVAGATEIRPVRSSSLLHLRNYSVAAPSGFKYDRISTALQHLFIAQEEEEDEEYDYNDFDAFVDDNSSTDTSSSVSLKTNVEELTDASYLAEDVPTAPSRAPPPPPPPPVLAVSQVELSETTEGASYQHTSMSCSARASRDSTLFAHPQASPTSSDGTNNPPSPSFSASDLPPSPSLSPWDPSAPFDNSPALITYSPGLLGQHHLYSPGLTPPPLSAMSTTSKFGYDAPHSPLLAIARTVSVVMTGNRASKFATSSMEASAAYMPRPGAVSKQYPQFLTRSRSERLVGGYSSGKVSTPTVVSVEHMDHSYLNAETRHDDVHTSTSDQSLEQGNSAWLLSRISCRGSVIDLSDEAAPPAMPLGPACPAVIANWNDE